MAVEETIAVLGLGYVGLPVALAFARSFSRVVGFDIDREKVAELRAGHDRNGEISEGDLRASKLVISSEEADLRGCTFYVVAVPTPVDQNNVPDLSPVTRASETVGRSLAPGGCVVYESTVYPGVTEEICAPILQRVSGLARESFRVGYSPERINPGDHEHSLERIVKVVSGEDAPTLERVANVYGKVVTAGVHRAPSVKVAEAAKVIENTQRDINIALMNELAIIFDRMGIRTADVLAAAATKWNFLNFRPGLVGGHCIGVDPYYLTTKAQQLGYQPEVILAGRRINNAMGPILARRAVKMLVNADLPVKGARIGIFGVTFKENVNDLRNSKVPDIVRELSEFGVTALVHDPLASSAEAVREYGLSLTPWEEMRGLDGVVLAVNHAFYTELGAEKLLTPVRDGGIVIDVKSALSPSAMTRDLRYYSL